MQLASVADESSLQSADVGTVLLAVAVGAGVAFLVGGRLMVGLRWLGRRTGLEIEWTGLQKSSIAILFVVVAVKVILESADPERRWVERLMNVLDVALIAIVGWIVLIVAQLIEQATLRKFPATTLADRKSRTPAPRSRCSTRSPMRRSSRSSSAPSCGRSLASRRSASPCSPRRA